MRRFGICLVLALCAARVLAQTSATETVLHDFADSATEGGDPVGQIIQAADGKFYGVTRNGGANKLGTVFKVTPTGTVTTLYSFAGGAEGDFPESGLIQGGDGNFYGVLFEGGDTTDCTIDPRCGVLYKITPAGKFSVLYTFTPSGSVYPNGPLIQGNDGNFYGTADGGYYNEGGQPLLGEIFSISPSGVLTTLPLPANQNFDTYAGLLETSPGTFYGTDFGNTTVFQVTSSAYTTVATVDTETSGPGFPNWALAEAEDGTLVSVAQNNSVATYGGIYYVAGSGVDTPYVFTQAQAAPAGPLYAAGDGNFYGAFTGVGGTSCAPNCGGIFTYSLASGFNTLYAFTGKPDGNDPLGAPVQGADGKFYGTTGEGGSGHGTFYSLTPNTFPAAPIQLTLGQPSVGPGDSVTLNWQASNAFSTTMQQCYLFATPEGGTPVPIEKLSGTYNSGTHVFSGSTDVEVASNSPLGSALLAVTCGGIETGLVTLYVDAPTTTTLTSSKNPANVGETVTLTASVTSAFGTPTGSVTFTLQGGEVLATVNLVDGAAKLGADTSQLAPGSYEITARYSPNLSSGFSASASNLLIQQLFSVNTTTTLTASPNPAEIGNEVVLTAKVSAQDGSTPQGTVDFYFQNKVLGSATLSGGQAVLGGQTMNLSAGGYEVVAAYQPTDRYSFSESDGVDVTLNKAPTTTIITATPNPAPSGATIFVGISVERQTSGTANGTASLIYEGENLGNITLANGAAVFDAVTTNLPPGSYRFSVRYNGDDADETSTSNFVTVVLQ